MTNLSYYNDKKLIQMEKSQKLIKLYIKIVKKKTGVSGLM